jgi:hypothetical protein
MEFILVVLGIILFDLAAMWWGHDSREHAQSAEGWFAAHGFAWDGGARSSS